MSDSDVDCISESEVFKHNPKEAMKRFQESTEIPSTDSSDDEKEIKRRRRCAWERTKKHAE